LGAQAAPVDGQGRHEDPIPAHEPQIAPHTLPTVPDETSPGNLSGIHEMSVHPPPSSWSRQEMLPVLWTEPERVLPRPQPVPPQRTSSGTNTRRMTWQLPGRSDATPADARRLVTQTCRLWNIPPHAIQDLTLIVSELATNALLHAPNDRVTVGMILTRDDVWVFCADQGPRRPIKTNPAHADDEHGRGLLIVDTLASRYTVNPCGRGTAVAACLTLPASTTLPVHTPQGTVAAAPCEDSCDATHSHI
jgi:anti-sigma regulatory factor (Ser/Thr protein kinase)